MARLPQVSTEVFVVTCFHLLAPDQICVSHSSASASAFSSGKKLEFNKMDYQT